MPIIKSAVKRAKQTKVRHERNLGTKQDVRTAVKAVESAVAAKDGKKAAAALVDAQSALDTAVKKNVIHKNKAARKKAQLSTLTKTVSGSAATKKPAAKKAPAKKPAAKTASAKKPTTKKTPAKKTAAKK